MVDRHHLPNSIPWAAAQLGISTSTMQRLVARKEVKTVKVNGLRRIPDSEIERLQPVMEAVRIGRCNGSPSRRARSIAGASRPKSVHWRGGSNSSRSCASWSLPEQDGGWSALPNSKLADMKRPGVSHPITDRKTARPVTGATKC